MGHVAPYFPPRTVAYARPYASDYGWYDGPAYHEVAEIPRATWDKLSRPSPEFTADYTLVRQVGMDMGTRDDDAKCWTGGAPKVVGAIGQAEMARFMEKLLLQFEHYDDRYDLGRRAWESLRHQGVDLPDYDWAVAEQHRRRQHACFSYRKEP